MELVDSLREVKTIPKKLFLYVYLILPVLLFVALVDMFYFDFWLRPYMGIEAILLHSLFLFLTCRTLLRA